MINIPVAIATAQRDESVKFCQLCPVCNSRIQYKKWCEKCGKEVKYSEIKKGFEIGKDEYVVLEKEQIEELKAKTDGTIEILKVIDTNLDSIYYKKSYYLIPQHKKIKGSTTYIGVKPFILLQKALSLYGKTLLVKFVLRSKEQIAIVKPYKNVFVLTTLCYENEVVKLDLEEFDAEVKKQELELANQLLNKMSGNVNLADYRDEYGNKVKQLIEGKLSGAVEVETAKPKEEEDNMEELLKASL